MTQRSLATVAFKVWGTMLLVESILFLPSLYFILNPPYKVATESLGYSVVVYQGLGVFVGIAAGLVVILKADVISGRLFPSDAAVSFGVDAASLLGVILAAVGLVFVITGLRGVVAAVYVLIEKPGWVETPNAEYLWSRQQEASVRPLVELIAGLVLFFRSRYLVTLWSRSNSERAAEAAAPSETNGDQSGAS